MADENVVAAGDAAPAPAAGTALTGGDPAPAPSGETGGQQAQSPQAGQGEAAAAAGQGADTGQAGDAGNASVQGDATTGGEGGESAQGAPEQYDAFSMPEGFELTGDLLEGLASHAKAQNYTQAQAQTLVDLGVKQAQSIMQRFHLDKAAEQPVLLKDHWASEWSKQTAADPKLGGTTENLKASMGLAQRVFSTFATPELGKFLSDTGLSHHPEIIRFMTAVGKAVSEDTLVTPQGGQNGSTSRSDEATARKLFPSMN